MTWATTTGKLHNLLQTLTVTNKTAISLDPDQGFKQWQQLTKDIRTTHKTIYLIGNGASASMASHMAADLAKNGHIHTEVFSDLALLTAISNDLDFTEVFAEPLRRRLAPGDMVVAISSSGASPNIIKACAEALAREAIVITLSAMAPTNPLRRNGTYNFYVPATTYGMAETSHAAILHHWMDSVALPEST